MQGFRDSCQQQLSVKRLPEKPANALSAALVGALLGVFVAEGVFGVAVLISIAGAILAWTLPRLKSHSQQHDQPEAEGTAS